MLTQIRRVGHGSLHGTAGFFLLALGEVLIVVRVRPLSDFYFPVIWLGYILFLDGAILRQRGRSPFATMRPVFLVLFPLSALFWWLFELFNAVVHNWVYIGGQAYTGLLFVVVASLDFSTVVLAVWSTALFLDALFPPELGRTGRSRPVPSWVPPLMLVCGALALALPLLFPAYAFGLIWGCMYLLLDPINYWLGRPSIIGALWRGNWRLPASFALGALVCGFFWEAWNYWSMPKWIYTIPYVDQWHVFEMPLLGWLGYLPFGLELFAMVNFVLPLLRLPGLDLELELFRNSLPRHSRKVATGSPATERIFSPSGPSVRRREY